MGKTIGCSIIIKDDFNNMLIVTKKVKKSQPNLWYLVGRNLRGKETTEKCINRAVKDDLKVNIFDLKIVDEYKISEDENFIIYTGNVKESINIGKDIVQYKWINKESVDSYDFAENEKEKILAYLNK
ncbi:NUDIX domain-containing protein [Clostridium chauvoei]|uniref:Nudix hydrolase domain-containing protein n=2 Tax=Clostridium chauvoei TaxID=46867 RepID=S6EPC2_9CLOT|nr:NUDIX domain-containing protein [Clostridium chauvoei]ATD54514.1 hypothetical protein BTM20_04405 [Clostridium chauvoei]ATD57804.1 hypothetical protein BTM21_08655 [Clostridium chauvoei]MBX7281064.1 hypothetical protein [Clostridium chauvoei]MBX7283549.1 hypothetical protein [Clostridium chauvoei]MBX7286037.1 hypothetical protein [Clostridium chauvoei]